MSSDKRRHKRHPKRLPVLFGPKDLTHRGFTLNISSGGMFVVTSQILPLDTRVHLQVLLGADRWVSFEGVVVRQKQVPAELRRIQQGGFGVRFLAPSEVAAEALGVKDDRFLIEYATREQLEAAFEAEIRHGGVFIHTDRVLPRDSSTTVTLQLPFAQRELVFEAKVVHASPGSPAGNVARGLGLLFSDATGVIQKLTALLG